MEHAGSIAGPHAQGLVYRRAICVGGILVASWVTVFLLQGAFRYGFNANAHIGPFIAASLAGEGVWLVIQRDAGRRARVAGGVFCVLAAFVYAFSSMHLFVMLFMTDNGAMSFDTPPHVDACIRFASMLVAAGAAVGSAILAKRAWRQNPPSNETLAAAGVAAGVFGLLFFVSMILRASGGANIPWLAGTALADAGVLFLAVPFLQALCKSNMGRLRLRGAGLAWAWLAAAGALFSLVMLSVSYAMDGVGATGNDYATALVLPGFLLAGYIMLLCGRKQGLYVIVGSAGIILGSQFIANLYNVLLAGDVSFVVGTFMQVIAAINPVFAWLSVRYSSTPAAAPQAGVVGEGGIAIPVAQAVSRVGAASVSAFDWTAVVANLVAGSLFTVATVIVATAELEPPTMLFLVVSGVILAVGVWGLVALLRRSASGYPPWMRAMQTATFAFSAFLLLLAVVMYFELAFFSGL